LNRGKASPKIEPPFEEVTVPHNFIRTNPEGPSSDSAEGPKHELRKFADVDRICRRHSGALESLLFDADEKPAFAYVVVDEGDVRAIIADLGGGEHLSTYYDRDEVKS
jgi:hypothetical protein